MRLGKKKEKEKDSDGRSQIVEGVSRLICSVKTSHSAPMRGNERNIHLIGTKCNFGLFSSCDRWHGLGRCEIFPIKFNMANAHKIFHSIFSRSTVSAI